MRTNDDDYAVKWRAKMRFCFPALKVEGHNGLFGNSFGEHLCHAKKQQHKYSTVQDHARAPWMIHNNFNHYECSSNIT